MYVNYARKPVSSIVLPKVLLQAMKKYYIKYYVIFFTQLLATSISVAASLKEVFLQKNILLLTN